MEREGLELKEQASFRPWAAAPRLEIELSTSSEFSGVGFGVNSMREEHVCSSRI